MHTENRQSPTHVHLLCSSWLPVAGTCQTLGSTLLVVQRSHSRAGGVKRRPVRDATELSLSLQPVGMSDRCRREVGQESGEAPGLRRTQVQPGVRSSSKVVFPRTASLWVLVRQVESHLNGSSVSVWCRTTADSVPPARNCVLFLFSSHLVTLNCGVSSVLFHLRAHLSPENPSKGLYVVAVHAPQSARLSFIGF